MGGNYLCGFVIHQDLGLGKSKLVENENALTSRWRYWMRTIFCH